MKRFSALGALLLALVLAVPAQAQIQAGQQAESVYSEDAGPIVAHLVAELDKPWGMAFLPDGRLLVTEKSGNLRLIDHDGSVSDPIQGTPDVFFGGQGGLLDVAIDPEFDTNPYVYLSYARPGPEGTSATAVGRGMMEDGELKDFEVLFTQTPWISNTYHFGNRIAFSPEGHLFLALGERFQFDPAQDLSNHLGKVIRINRDGSIPSDNPFVGQADARDEIWSYGHRNVEAAAFHPVTGDFWLVEMGPFGGDELNRVERGQNYGWPVVSWGINYDGTNIPDPPTRPEFEDAAHVWSPVISPSGMLFYDGDVFPEWKGSVFIGSLSSHQLVRLVVQGGNVVKETRLPLGSRIRDVEAGPDGHLYVLSEKDGGQLWKLSKMPIK